MFKYLNPNEIKKAPDVISFAIANYENNPDTKIVANVLGYAEELRDDGKPDDGKEYEPIYEEIREQVTKTITVPVILRHWTEVQR